MKENKGINEILNKLDSEDRERLASYISEEVRDALDDSHELDNYEVLEKDFWIEKMKPTEYKVAPRRTAEILLDLGFEHEAKDGQTLEGPYNEDVFSNTLQEGSIRIRFVSSPSNRYIEVSIAKDGSTEGSFRFPLTPRNTLLLDNPSVIEFVRTYSVSSRMKEVDADDDVDYEGSSFAVYFSINRKNRSYWLKGVSKYKDKILFSYYLQ